MSQEQTECIICGKICGYKDWAVYDGASNYCKCKECLKENKTSARPWSITFPKNNVLLYKTQF